MAHYKISNRVSQLLIFYLLVFDRIHDTMCLNKIFMTSSRNIGPQHKQYSSIFHCTHGVLFNLLSNFVDRFMPKHTHYTLTNIQKEKKHNRTPLGTYISNFFPLPDKKTVTAVDKRDKTSGLFRNDRQKCLRLQHTLLIRKGSIKCGLLLLWVHLKISCISRLCCEWNNCVHVCKNKLTIYNHW